MQNSFCSFHWSRQVIRESGDYPLLPGCFSWMVVNTAAVGGPVCYVDGYPLHAPLSAGANGEHHGVGGPFGSVINSSSVMLEIRFSTDVGASCFLRQLFYTKMNYGI